MFLTAVTNEIWQAILAYGLMAGFGSSMIFTPCYGCLAPYFRKRAALALGLVRSGSWIGSIALVPITTLIRDTYGWRSQCVFMGGISLLMIFAGALYRPRSPLAPTKKSSIKDVVCSSFITQRHVRFTVWVWLLSLHSFCYYLSLFHLVRHAECKLDDVDHTSATLFLVYIAVAAVIADVIAGILQDKLLSNKLLLLQFLIFLGGVNNMSFPFLTTYSHLVVFAVITGVAAAYIPVTCVIPQVLVGKKDAVNAFGIYVLSSGITSCLGGPAAGWYYDRYGSYDGIFVISGGMSVLSSMLMFSDIYLKKYAVTADDDDTVEASRADGEVSRAQDVITSMESSV
ncbi:monocarboxylate transporter 14-like [Corticium candelabrum]|uniref:monocarboxylate transporter 14-like n=1 Tax=Corticium candelabrum TaxID=121492 RepID=UPI002E26D663|nr:monocarboxylate transporter 14-like [Corticium candelabrum]